MSCGEARGRYKDGVSLTIFPDCVSVASRYVANLKLVPHVEAPGQVMGFSHGQTVGVFHSILCAVPWVQ